MIIQRDLNRKGDKMPMIMNALEETGKRFSDKQAFIDDRRCISFSDLNQEIYRIASVLIAKKYQRKSVVVFLDKSIECIVSFLGVAITGNFYTPIDTSMPRSRIEKIMQILHPSAIITDAQHMEQVRKFVADAEILVYEDIMAGDVNIEAVMKASQTVIDSDALYVLFTSGSTGTPKGVVISHRAMMDYVEWVADKFQIDETSVLGNQSPLYFDLSIQDVYLPFLTGCTVVLLPEQKFMRPKLLLHELIEHNVNTIFWVPSALCLLADFKALQMKELPELRKILFCGEVMPVKYLNQWRSAFPEAEFVNLYGPTEACDACAYYIVERDFAVDQKLPIGMARENMDIFLLDEQNRLIGEPHETGEICIRGISLSSGYYRMPEKTRESFIQNPLHSEYNDIIYRTGDLGEYNDAGELMYVSRKDWQIKHMGHRIELGEIEVTSMTIDGVQRAVCLYDAEKRKIILVYVGEPEEKDVFKQLKNLIPLYMLPETICKVEQLPKNRNGKTDRVYLKKLMNID